MRTRAVSIVAYVILLAIGAAACDSTDPVDDEITNIRMLPEDATFSAGEEVDFSVVGITESGDVVEEPMLDLRWWSSDTTVFTVDESGTAIGQGAGTAYCKAEAQTLTKAALRFVGRDSAFVRVLK